MYYVCCGRAYSSLHAKDTGVELSILGSSLTLSWQSLNLATPWLDFSISSALLVVLFLGILYLFKRKSSSTSGSKKEGKKLWLQIGGSNKNSIVCAYADVDEAI